MKKTVVILLLSGSLFAIGCSRPTAEAPASAQATPTPEKSERELAKEKTLKADTVEAHEMKTVPATDNPVVAGSPSPSASSPTP